MKISKKKDLEFRTQCTLLVLCENAIPINEKLVNGNYKIIGSKDSVEITIRENEFLYSVFCRFDKHNELTGFNNTKHNFHTTADLNTAMKEFEFFLKELVKYL